jgi:hypothetical protein
LLLILGLLGWSTVEAATPPPGVGKTASATDQLEPALRGRVVAVGIVGASAISPVGDFLPGGELHEDPRFTPFTSSGRVLDPGRILVASSSNFGAPRALPDWPSGAILSIDPRASERLIVPPDFAVAGNQASASEGAVQLFTAQSPAFLNSLQNPQARTAALPAVSNPRGITVNNAFGRPWFANAPLGALAPGTETSIDPDGRPRVALRRVAGGVFAGDQTNRPSQLIRGSLVGSVGTALLGTSPDGTPRGVYAVVNSDGSVVQVHIRQGVDGLAPPGTIGAISTVDLGFASSTESVATRTGIVFNWVPDKILYVADPARNAVVALTLVDDGRVFRVQDVRRIESSRFDMPVDLAAAVPEIVSRVFASNTTLAGGADLYVANRGNGTIVRLRQDGTVLAVRQVEVPGVGTLGPGRLNGIAVSPDAERIYVTVTGPLDDTMEMEGSVIELPAFYGNGS